MSIALSDAVIGAMLLMCRIGGCFMLLPGFSSAAIPVRIRLYVAIGVTLSLYPLLYGKVEPFFQGQSHSALLLLLISEALSGVLIGFLGRLLFLALETMSVAMAMALSLSNPSGISFEQMEALPPVSTIIGLSAVMMLFATDLHWEVLRAIKGSYDHMPPGQFFQARLSLVSIVDQLTYAFLLALRISSPLLIYSVIVNFTIGLVNRFTPQIQVYFISMPFVIVGGLIILYSLIQGMLSQFMQGVSRWFVFGG